MGDRTIGDRTIGDPMGIRVTGRDLLDNALKSALAYAGPALVEILTDSELV